MRVTCDGYQFGELREECYGLNICILLPPNLYIEVLIPNAMYLEIGL